MRLNINKIKLVPKNLTFGFAVYGNPTEEILEWIKYWGLKIQSTGPYNNITLPLGVNIKDLFEEPKIYKYGDFFSPNLNKELHLGHLSNLIIAKTLQCLGITQKTIAILGDTLDGLVSKDEALRAYKYYCMQYDYPIDDIYFASAQTLDPSVLKDGTGDYEGTKVFEIGDQKIVGLKSTGASTYFYQDVALATKLNSPTLYVTGLEQNGHFALLNELFPNIKHIGLGLVTVDGKKMSSSEGNVIMMAEILKQVHGKFNNDFDLTWNVLCGHILKYDLSSMKDIKMSQIDNVKTSFGLYLSYTLARIKSAGLKPQRIEIFNSNVLEFKLLKARTLIAPNLLFDELVEHAKLINQLYITKHIKENPQNQILFQPLLDDLMHGMKLLGMYEIEKV